MRRHKNEIGLPHSFTKASVRRVKSFDGINSFGIVFRKIKIWYANQETSIMSPHLKFIYDTASA